MELQRETVFGTSPKAKLSKTTTTAVSSDPPPAKPTLKTLQQDPAVQMELSDLMNSLGEPVLLGLTVAEQDPAQKLLEPNASQGKHPFLIADFVSTLPLVLQEDRETVLGTSGNARIILKSSHEKKLSLDKISFPQWSAANFCIMHTLMKDGSLSSTQDVLDYVMYSSKVSEFAKSYPLPRVTQYDDLYRRMQFTTTSSSPQATRRTPRLIINQTTGKQVCFEFQRREGCRFGSSCRYDHVCIKPQCLGSHPQWQHPTSSSLDPQY